ASAAYSPPRTGGERFPAQTHAAFMVEPAMTYGPYRKSDTTCQPIAAAIPRRAFRGSEEDSPGMADADHSGIGAPVAGNRLGGETSPYLLQHRDNPVAWR